MMVGSSMGSNLALVGCAAVENCAGAVALSPSLNYFGVHTHDALGAGFPMMIVYADHDPYPADDMDEMKTLASDRLTLLTYTGRAHGMLLFGQDATLPSQIVAWLQAR
jgi:dienelactone hydrolase